MVRDKLIIVGILMLALIIRFWGLSVIPPSLNWDEVSHGYNAYSLLKTGSDEWGQWFPLANFRAYGDYPTTLNMYLTVPIIFLFGLNEFSVRFISAFLGSLMVVVLYFLTKHLTKNYIIGLLAALLVAVSPWSVLISRQAIQATSGVFFLCLGLLAFFKVKPTRKYLLPLGVFLVCLSAYGYHNTRMLSPLILVFCLYFLKEILLESKKLLIISLSIIFITFSPIALSLLSPGGSARSVWVGIIDQGAVNRINEMRGQSDLPDELKILAFNKVTYFTLTSINNYLGYFDPRFLGFFGGSHYQFSIPGYGIVQLIYLPFFYIGMIILLITIKKQDYQRKILLLWLLISPIPAAITRDSYQVVRSFAMMPAFYLVTGIGLLYFWRYVLSKTKNMIIPLVSIFLIILAISSWKFFYEYWFIYPSKFSSAWQYGYKQVAEYIKDHEVNYNKIYVTKRYGEPHEFLLFYGQYDPNKYKTDPNLVRYEKSNWYWVDSFDKFIFLNDWEVIKKTANIKNSLLITSPGNYPENATLLESVYFLDGSKSFDIVKL